MRAPAEQLASRACSSHAFGRRAFGETPTSATTVVLRLSGEAPECTTPVRGAAWRNTKLLRVLNLLEQCDNAIGKEVWPLKQLLCTLRQLQALLVVQAIHRSDHTERFRRIDVGLVDRLVGWAVSCGVPQFARQIQFGAQKP